MAVISSENEESIEIIIDDEDEYLYSNTPSGTTLTEEDDSPIIVSQSSDVIVVETSTSRGPAGPPGSDGDPGIDGTDGTDGRDIELNKSATHIQWRYVGNVDWIDLVPLADLGPQGGIYFARGVAAGTVGVPGVLFYGVGVAVAGTQRHMVPFEVDSTISVSSFSLDVLITGTESTLRVGVIEADTQNQPTGSVLAQTTIAVNTSGARTQPVTPFTLPAGRYLLMYQGDNLGIVTLRAYRAASNALKSTLGSQPIVERYTYQHSAAQPMDASPWSSFTTLNFGNSHSVLMEYEYV